MPDTDEHLMCATVPSIDAIIPALNEERSICDVLDAIPSFVRCAIVVDNGSTDSTALAARSRGAHVVHEPRRGYGAACLRGLAELDRIDGKEPPDIVVFLDADRSDVPQEMERLIEPIQDDSADLVIGSRVLGNVEPGALTPPQRFGNKLASALIRRIWGVRCTDLGPFRAIRFDAIKRLRMNDLDYGWTVQMQARAARLGMRTIEVPVSYRKRVGVSKISGTLRGVIGAGTKILGTIALEAAAARRDGRTDKPRREKLIVFSRLPVPGKAKTRLIPALGEEGAAELQRKMTMHTLNVARRWRENASADGHQPPGLETSSVEVRYTSGERDAMINLFGDDFTYADQGEGSLGERMLKAIHDHCSKAQSASTVIIGSDCPGISPRIIRSAFAALHASDVVIGPATDGGYYLIGMRESHRAVFAGIDWGSERVLEQTLRACRASRLRVTHLEPLADVDEPVDITSWERLEAAIDANGRSPEVSIIIPAFNEAERIGFAIRSARTRKDIEIIVVDGGSTDDTIPIARELGAKVIDSKLCRAAQMNRGAAAASGDVLLFLHADTRLPFGYRSEIDRVLAQPNVVAGAFRLALDHVNHSLRLIEFGANVRSRRRQRPYGDQALFLSRFCFDAVGGFRDWPAMEDYEFVRRLRTRGRIAIADSAVITSARRWLTHGAWRTTLRHQRAILSYTFGVAPERIAAMLRPRRHGVTASQTRETTPAARHLIP